MVNIRKDLIGAEVDTLRALCNFTDDELAVFELLARGKSLVYVSMHTNLSPRTVDRRVQAIKNKVAKVWRDVGELPY